MSRNRAQSKTERKRRLINRKRRIQYRLRDRHWTDQPRPMFRASNIHYELADRARGLVPGGIGAMHLVARQTGLVEAIDRRLHLLKVHLPYHESDHVLNMAYNILSGGTCLEDIELWRNDEVYLDALGAQRIPDPTTAGDFCRRFEEIDVEILMNTINSVRVKVWQQQPASFLEEAVIEGDGAMAETTGRCKQGMDINYKGQWGYHPLLISLANTAEPLYLVNRRGSRPSHEGAAVRLDQSIALCRRAGFKNIRLESEQVAEFAYRPTLCEKSYRVVVVRKNLSVEKGEQVLFDDVRYFFYITNDGETSADEVVFLANGRCNQENLIEQLKNGVRAMQMPVDNLVSNWAYMVMASLAWTLKSWFALLLPQTGRWATQHQDEKQRVLKMEFKRFVNAFVRVPCQVVRSGRRIVCRLLAWNGWQHVFLRGVDGLRAMSGWRHPLRC